MKKLELNFNRKHVIIFCLLVIILLATIFLIRNTYGYYQENLELKDSLGMTVATLSYGLNEEYKVVVPAKGEVRVPISVMGLNSQETKYQMYYRSSNDLGNVVIGYASYSSNLPSGDLMIGESKQVSLILKNNGDSEATLFIGVKGGYQNNSVEDIILGNGEIRITNRIESEEVSEDMATPEDILAGKKAWVNGNQITGTMVNRGTVNQTLKAGESYTIPEGYHNGKGVINSASLASQTEGTATADNISNGMTAWVNGNLITGNGKDVSDAIGNAKVVDVLSYKWGTVPTHGENFENIYGNYILDRDISDSNYLLLYIVADPDAGPTTYRFHLDDTIVKSLNSLNPAWYFSFGSLPEYEMVLLDISNYSNFKIEMYCDNCKGPGAGSVWYLAVFLEDINFSEELHHQ